ncbi:MAG: DUF1929 domain-containing protein, partial [Nitrosopumilaceae archaeon]|nr:DUF1929 domain-containing protein [Nitrosopumilaceae archaeon]NIU86567.1 DUF1929 domain-containing protein [Nitrosopumilaceae archaeon]NIV65262.1 DUF1929 domain-containing protein [Nitrosopumilaceae archaeon]NIX60761.1 DUF1929 domain-containing protein [Nitrosopumilaceae archaeon]
TTIPEILTVNLTNPPSSDGWKETKPHLKRFLCDSVLLPDGNVLVTNGAQQGTADHNQKKVMDVEIFDSTTETWSVIGKLKKPRLYHGTAILLADGRVLVAGSTGHNFPVAIFNPPKHFEQEIEFITPPYLKNNPIRPQIEDYAESILYDSVFKILIGSSEIIEKVSMIRLSSTTHNNNMDQRCLFLQILEKTGDTITLKSPKDGSWAPPGYYMLFIVDANGVPSTAKFVHLS